MLLRRRGGGIFRLWKYHLSVKGRVPSQPKRCIGDDTGQENVAEEIPFADALQSRADAARWCQFANGQTTKQCADLKHTDKPTHFRGSRLGSDFMSVPTALQLEPKGEGQIEQEPRQDRDANKYCDGFAVTRH
jgi:hypothetical protein